MDNMQIESIANYIPSIFGKSTPPKPLRTTSSGDLGLAERAVLVAGSPRSGTTWLAKLLDSHPDALYRHEPDEVSPPIPGADPCSQLVAWIHERRLRAAAKAPSFRKSWLPAPLGLVRTTVAHGLKGVVRLTGSRRLEAALPVPDIVSIGRRSNLRPVIKLVHWDVNDLLRAVPQCRALFILRHPCGQIDSAMRGVAERRFKPREDGVLSPSEQAAAAYAASHGVDAASFGKLPDPAKRAWIWRTFNEPALVGFEGLSNVRLVRYEELCMDPEGVTRELFRFVGLDWHPQTEKFIARSTQQDGESDYYDVFRSSVAVAQRWRQTMAPEDQEAVRLVVRDSPVAHHWPELCN
jgi:LPS sulfotransferase NodH